MLQIEIFSDAICPWCFIGKRRLDAALAVSEQPGGLDPQVSLRWRPYLLYPNLPSDGVDRADLLRRRYGPRGDKSRVPANILAEAQGEGIELRYDLINRTPNTRAAHRLLEWVYEHRGWETQHELAEKLFQAYFCQGLDVGQPEVLIQIAQAVDVDSEQARDVLSPQTEVGRALDAEIDEQLQRGIDLGVSGVPGYVMGGSYLLPGAQSVETMQAIISRAKVRFASS